MPTETQTPYDDGYEDDDFSDEDIQEIIGQNHMMHSFIEAGKEIAVTNGACIYEHWQCPKCKTGQQCFHPFLETLTCQRKGCRHRVASKVPRFDLPGEVTKYHLQEAFRQVTALLGQCEIDDEAEQKITAKLKETPGVAAMVSALTVKNTKRMLQQVEKIARSYSGGHGG